MPDPANPRVDAVVPSSALVGARVTVHGRGVAPAGGGLPAVQVGGVAAQVVMASSSRLAAVVPDNVARGRHAVTVDGADGGAMDSTMALGDSGTGGCGRRGRYSSSSSTFQ